MPTPVLFVLRPRLEGRVLVTQERLSFGIAVPSYEFQDSHGNITYRSMLMPGRNEIRHDALVAVSSLQDSREMTGPMQPIGQLAPELLRYTLPSRYCDSDKLMNFAWKFMLPMGLLNIVVVACWRFTESWNFRGAGVSRWLMCATFLVLPYVFLGRGLTGSRRTAKRVYRYAD